MVDDPFDLNGRLATIAQQSLYRRRRVVSTPQGVQVVVDGRSVVNFCSNDYLGLANHPAVVAAFKKAVDRLGCGSGSAHLICGHSSAHHALEEELAVFTGRDRVLLFSTGYMANIGVIGALLGKGDRVLEDRLNHASLLDGGMNTPAQFVRYRHGNVDDLAAKLAGNEARTLIVTDGVFSMDGDLAPLPEMVKQARLYRAWLMVDDAHGMGTLGATGAGIVEHYGLSQADVPILIGTLGKGFGTFGAFVAGSEQLIEWLLQKARTYIYTTALPGAVAEATRVSLKILVNDTWRRDKLRILVTRFRRGAQQLGLPVLESITPIQPLLMGDSMKAVAASEALLQSGFWVTAIRPPTVPPGGARLRITFSAQHEEQQVDALLDALARVCR